MAYETSSSTGYAKASLQIDIMKKVDEGQHYNRIPGQKLIMHQGYILTILLDLFSFVL